ncbi:MAG: hypothetical protein PF447_00225 [Spirochaetaceae bacterium]|jgi:hypothetical protein|nr:hypothetical protein [Spirochaetaceae bacterium]
MTELSLEQQDRGGGHQAKAEILEMTMDFSAARQEYIRADEMMDNPLAKKDLARLYCDWGFFEEALQYCRSVENQEDTRWMYSYGIDGQEMDRDMAELYRDIYGGIVNREALLPQSTLWKSVKTWGQRIYFHILSLYHGSRYRSLSKEAGEKQLEQGNNIQGWWILAQGSRGFSATAMEYFRLARQEEVARVASAAPWYDLEIAREAGNTSTLKNLLPAFDAHWEAWAVAETLKALVDHLPRNSRDSVVYRQQLYLMNPGALLVLGDALPFTLQFSSSEDLPEKRITRQITGILRRSGNLNGLRGSLGSTSQDAYSFNLMIQLNAQGFNWYLMDQENQSLAEGYEALNLESSREISEALRNMLLEIYNGVVG